MSHHAIPIVFLFLVGACVGSFLNVVVWRLPRVEPREDESGWRYYWRCWHALSWPPSHCPGCGNTLKWYDNLPIVGWLKLGGKCRYCKGPISSRYPIIETITALLFVFYYVMFYIVEVGPCPPLPPAPRLFSDSLPTNLFVPIGWPVLTLYLFLVAALLAASLIDAELFLIPAPINWTVAAVGLLFHTFYDHPTAAGALNLIGTSAGASPIAALAAGAGVGLSISIVLWSRGLLPISFAQGEPILEVDREAVEREIKEARRTGKPLPMLPPDYTPRQIRAEMRFEMLFLMPPMALAVLWFLLTEHVPALRPLWQSTLAHHWASGFLGALWGGLVGAFVVWITRILGTLAFGRVAMGLGDVDLMFAVGAVLGAGAATVAFFLAPFFGIAIALYLLVTGSRREVPYGPYLSLATGLVMLIYCKVALQLEPGMAGLGYVVRRLLGMEP